MTGSVLFLMLGTVIISLCDAYHSCKDLKEANPSVGNGVYSMFNGKGSEYTAYCEFHECYGYQFVAKSATSFNQAAISLIAPSTTQVVVRHLRLDGTQHDTIISQIEDKSNIPLSIQYNTNVNYATPKNYATWEPYLYLGFVPVNEVEAFSRQGYRANGVDFTFSNCNTDANSYMAFFFNANNGKPTDYGAPYAQLMREWIDIARPASDNLPSDFFFDLEMHFGGCGGYDISEYNSLQDVSGAALGMRFKL